MRKAKGLVIDKKIREMLMLFSGQARGSSLDAAGMIASISIGVGLYKAFEDQLKNGGDAHTLRPVLEMLGNRIDILRERFKSSQKIKEEVK